MFVLARPSRSAHTRTRTLTHTHTRARTHTHTRHALLRPILSHDTAHLNALHIGDVPRAREVEPVGFVQLGACYMCEKRERE
jgi:hypothetical protein